MNAVIPEGVTVVSGRKGLFVGVVGDASCSAEVMERARQIGRLLAERDCVLVCGGRGGVMEGACRGAKEAGGLTVGIIPGDDRREANPYVDIPIVTGMGEARNALVVKSSQAIIAVEGRYGTLSEIAFALKLGIPVVGLNTWRLSRRGEEDSGIVNAASVEQAVTLAIELAGRSLER